MARAQLTTTSRRSSTTSFRRAPDRKRLLRGRYCCAGAGDDEQREGGEPGDAEGLCRLAPSVRISWMAKDNEGWKEQEEKEEAAARAYHPYRRHGRAPSEMGRYHVTDWSTHPPPLLSPSSVTDRPTSHRAEPGLGEVQRLSHERKSRPAAHGDPPSANSGGTRVATGGSGCVPPASPEQSPARRSLPSARFGHRPKTHSRDVRGGRGAGPQQRASGAPEHTGGGGWNDTPLTGPSRPSGIRVRATNLTRSKQ